ncbi:MAG: FtsX-like permease family protein [Vicinamibacterales bacterium]
MMFVLRMAWRETRTSWARLGFFFLCVGLGVASIIVLRSVVQDVRITLMREARSLLGADIVVQTQRPWTPELRAQIGSLLEAVPPRNQTEVVDTQTMAASVGATSGGQVKLVELRGVEQAFPFYGTIDLTSGPYSHDLLEDRGAVVQPELLSALDVKLGDRILLAGQPFTVRGVIARDRSQRGGGIAFGPRVYVDLAALRQTSMLAYGSRVSNQLLLQLSSDSQVTVATESLRQALRNQLVSVRSWQTLEDRIGRSLSTAENYLSLVGFAIVVLGGIGVRSVTRVIVRQKIRSVAILKCLGVSSGQVLTIYLIQVLGLAALGSLVGLALSVIALQAIPTSVLIPLGLTSVGVTWASAVQGITVGLLVSALFAAVPLLEIRGVKPLLLLRADGASTSRRDPWTWTAGVLISAALAAVAVWQADSVRAGAYISGGLLVVTSVLYLCSLVLVRLTRPLQSSRSFALRHAAVSLARPGNQTRVILISVGLGCFVVVGVRATEQDLLREMSAQVGESSPDLVLIDIQEDQVGSLGNTIGAYLRSPARITPLMRGRVVQVDGRRVQLPTLEAVREHGKLVREFGLTFRDHLESNEHIVSGAFWSSASNDPPGEPVEVSVEERMATEARLSVGDTMRFDIAGMPVRGRVTSIRAVAWDDTQNGGFVFVLRPGAAVARLPHNYVAFLQVRQTGDDRGELQRAVVRTHPNVSAIDVRDIVASIREVVDNVTVGITIVGLVTLVGGVLILVGAVAMTKFQRLYETAIYRTLGASAGRIAAMMAIEYALIGCLAGALGGAGGAAMSWGLARFLFDIPWQPAPTLMLLAISMTGALVSGVGVAASADVLLRKPLATLAEER